MVELCGFFRNRVEVDKGILGVVFEAFSDGELGVRTNDVALFGGPANNWIVSFLVSALPPISNWSPNQMLGTPTVEAQNGALKPPPTCLGLEVPNLENLGIGDLPGMSTNSIMSFHNHTSMLVH